MKITSVMTIFLWFAILGVLLQILSSYLGGYTFFDTVYNFFFTEAALESRDFYFEMNYLNLFLLSTIFLIVYSILVKEKKQAVNKRAFRMLIFNISIILFGLVIFTIGYMKGLLYFEAYIGLSIMTLVITLMYTMGEILFLYIMDFAPRLYARYIKRSKIDDVRIN